MAQNDIHRVTLVSVYDGVTCLSSFHFQEVSGPLNVSAVEALASAFEGAWLPSIQAFHLSDVRFTAITARTLKPAMTAQFTNFINESGDLSGAGLPSTCIQQITVWPSQGGRRSANWYRFSGLPQGATRQGKLDNAHVTLLNSFGNAIISGNISSDGGEFRPCTRPRPSDNPGQAKGALIAYYVRPTVLNQRSRQFRVVTG